MSSEFAVVLALAFCGGSAAMADHRFTLRDYVHRPWNDEFVTYELDADAVPVSPILRGPAGESVPVQITRPPNGRIEVAFIVEELPADGELIYTLMEAEPGSGALERVGPASLRIDPAFDKGFCVRP